MLMVESLEQNYARSASHVVGSDPCMLSASELALRIARGEISAVDAVEAHIARIEQVNAKLNAVVVKRYDAARAEAREVDARRARGEPLPPLAGLPITIKECLDLAGTPSTFGLPARADTSADSDDVYVARLRAAGAIVVGKTNAAQLLMFTETDNPIHGRANNPWSEERSCGGSSGGEGAIVAAGGAALGLGTDIGGSIRIPAASCGIAALRPTAGRCPDLGRHSVPIGQRGCVSQVGPLARHVEDLALALAVLNEGSEPFVPLGDARGVNVARLRVAVFIDDGVLTPAPACVRAVREAADMLKAAGASVTEWQPPAAARAMAIWFGCLSADRGRGMKRLARGQRLDPRAGLFLRLAGMAPGLRRIVGPILKAVGQPRMAMVLSLFAPGDAAHYWRTIEAQIDYEREFRQALDQAPGGPFDLVLCPAYGTPAVRHGASADMPLAGAYTLIAVALGYPAGVVPVTRVRAGEETNRRKSADRVEATARATELGSAGLPVGVQVIARPWQEHVALAAMAAIEAAARRNADYPRAPRV